VGLNPNLEASVCVFSVLSFTFKVDALYKKPTKCLQTRLTLPMPAAKETSTVHNANFRHTTAYTAYKLRNFTRKLSLVIA